MHPSRVILAAALVAGCSGGIALSSAGDAGNDAPTVTAPDAARDAGIDAARDAANECSPPLQSCDAPHPKMYPADFARGCLSSPIELTDVCDTSVNRCYRNAGIGYDCAFAPDGGAFYAVMSDNDMLTAAGWRFVEPFFSFPNLHAVPADEQGSNADFARCGQLACLPPCPGVPDPGLAVCFIDAGPDGSSDAARD